MDSILFIFKTLIITAVVVVFMQVKWGNNTIENEAYHFLTSSSVIVPIENVADSAVVLVRNTWRKMTGIFNNKFSEKLQSENQPGQRHLQFTIERSKAASYGQKVKNKFIDETVVPTETKGGREGVPNPTKIDRSSASSTNDDDMIVGE
jgi:hypothetical protein